MNIRQLLLASITVMLLATSSVWAKSDRVPTDPPISVLPDRKPPQAPEIDAASGTSAIALLTGVLLLAGERSRSRSRRS